MIGTVWSRWHQLQLSLGWLRAGLGVDQRAILLDWINGLPDTQALNWYVAQALVAAEDDGVDHRLIIRSRQFLDDNDNRTYAARTRAFVLALAFGDATSESLLWLAGNLCGRQRVPRPLLRKDREAVARFTTMIEQLRRGIRGRDANEILTATRDLAVWDETDEVKTRDAGRLWRKFWHHVEWEALNRIYVWPLVYDLGAAAMIGMFPVAVDAHEGNASVELQSGRLVRAGAAQRRTWRDISVEAAALARDLVIQHTRHLKDGSRAWLERASFTVDLRPGDAIAEPFGIAFEVEDSSLSLLLATTFAARLLRRPMITAAVSGEILGQQHDARRGPIVADVKGIAEKLRYACGSGVFDTAIYPKTSETEVRDNLAIPVGMLARPVATLADALDAALTTAWRRQRRERLPTVAVEALSDYDALSAFFATADPVARLPSAFGIEDVAAYLQRAARQVRQVPNAPSGLVTVFAGTMPEDVGITGLRTLDKLFGLGHHRLPMSMTSDPQTLGGWIADRLDEECEEPLAKAPDLLCLTMPPQPEEEWRKLHLMRVLAVSMLTLPHRRIEWREHLGGVRVLLCDAPNLPPSSSNTLDGELEWAADALSLFRGPFSSKQALLTLTAAEVSDPDDAFNVLICHGIVVPSATRGLWLCHWTRAGQNRIKGNVHCAIALSYGGPLVAGGAIGLTFLEALEGLGVAEATHHFAQACTLLKQEGREQERMEVARFLATLLIVYIGAPDVYRSAGVHCEQFGAAFIDLLFQHLREGWQPDDASLQAIANLVVLRHRELASRRPRVAGLEEDDRQVRAVTSDVISALVVDAGDGMAERAGAASVLLRGRVPLEAEERPRLEALVGRALDDADGKKLAHIHPELLCERTARLKNRAHRHVRYLRCLQNGHGANAGLLLGMVGTAEPNAVEQLYREWSGGLTPAGHRWITSCAWKQAPYVLQNDYSRGYGYLQDYGIIA